jgi:ATP-binding cassette, subfamily B, bacterial
LKFSAFSITLGLKEISRILLHLIRALKLVWQSAPGWTLARIVILVLQTIQSLISLYLTKQLVDTVTFGVAATDKAAVFGNLTLVIGLIGMLSLLSSLLNLLSEVVNTEHSQLVTDYMYSILHTKAVEVDLEYYESPEYYDKLHRVQQEAPFRPVAVLDRLLGVGYNLISLLTMAGLLFWLHWSVALILFVSVIPGGIIRLKYAGEMYQWRCKSTATERQAGYFDSVLRSDWYAKEVRLFDLGILFIKRFRNVRQKLHRERLKITIRHSIKDLVTQASTTLAVLGSYAFIAYQTVQGSYTLGDLVMYSQVFQRGQGHLQGILSSLTSLYEDNLFLSDLYEFLNITQKVGEQTHPKSLPQPMKTGIAFHDVSFQYSTTTRQALFDINLTIRPGEVVALVGENGSGKTTLIKLLCRLYDPTTGNITIDGIDLSQFRITELRRQISVIFQDYAKYHLTASENIWLGNIDIPQDHEDVTKAAYRSGADAVIKSLPQGYDTILGKLFDQGEELSIGQWQKIALARAFLRDSQVIVLDEPTSALDPKAEEEVFQKFRQLIKGQAAILISHRLSTVKMADRIYVMEHGRIVENGTHEELMQLGASYAHLFETQAQHYR